MDPNFRRRLYAVPGLERPMAVYLVRNGVTDWSIFGSLSEKELRAVIVI